jgi:hypothetical protein
MARYNHGHMSISSNRGKGGAMSPAFQREQHLFVVRTWQEPSQVVPGEQWRGSVEHVPSGQRLYFTSLDQLNHFIATYTGWPPAGAGTVPGADAGRPESQDSPGIP